MEIEDKIADIKEDIRGLKAVYEKYDGSTFIGCQITMLISCFESELKDYLLERENK